MGSAETRMQVKHAKRPRVNMFIATSEIHMKHKLRMTPDQVGAQGQSRGFSI